MIVANSNVRCGGKGGTISGIKNSILLIVKMGGFEAEKKYNMLSVHLTM